MVLELGDAEERKQPSPRKRSALFQWNLQTLLLLTAAVAVWIGFVQYEQHNLLLRRRVAAMQRMAAELRIEDPQQIAVVRLQQMWIDEPRWDIHLPDGQYAMRLATRDIDWQRLPVAQEEGPLHPGEHRIELLQSKDNDAPKLTVLVDGQIVIEATETSDWDPRHGFGGGEHFDICTQRSPDKPVILFRRIFMQLQKDGSYSTEGATNGILLWIEPLNPTTR